MPAPSPGLTPARPAGDGGERLLSDGLVLGGPGALLSALGQARTGHMGDIIGTIQREQDEIIRSPLAGVLVVQGGPGTGKTAVALHRAAYLLYTHRFPLERQGVLVVGPNPLFLRYIEQVLPSLGETGVSLSTVAGLVPEVRVRGVDDPARRQVEGRRAHGQGAGAGRAHAPASVAHATSRSRSVPACCGCGPTTTEDIVAVARRRPGTHNVRRRFVETQVLRALSDEYRARLSRGEAAPLADDVPSQEELNDLLQRLRRVPEVAEALDRMWPRLSPARIPPRPPRRAAPARRGGQGASSSAAEVQRLYRPRGASLDAVPWTVADTALIDEARTLLGPRRGGRTGTRPERRGARRRSAREVGFWPQGLAASPAPATRTGARRRRRDPVLRPHRGRRGAGPVAHAAAHAGAPVALRFHDRGRRHRAGDGPVGARRVGTTSPAT